VNDFRYKDQTRKLDKIVVYKSDFSFYSFKIEKSKAKTLILGQENGKRDYIDLTNKQVKTVRVRQYENKINALRIVFSDDHEDHITCFKEERGEWDDFPIAHNEAICGVYGSSEENHPCYIKKLGFVIGKFD